MFGLRCALVVLPCVLADLGRELLVVMNETNETELWMANPDYGKTTMPTMAPTIQKIVYTMTATIGSASDAPTLAQLTTAAQAGCSGCTVTPVLVFEVTQTVTFSGVDCTVFTAAVAKKVLAETMSVTVDKITVSITCAAARRLASHTVATGDVAIESTVTTSDSTQADALKTAGAALASDPAAGAAVAEAFGNEVGVVLPAPTISQPEMAFEVTYTVTNDGGGAAIAPPTTAAFAAAVTDTGAKTLTFQVATPAPTAMPTSMPTPLPVGATFMPTAMPTQSPPTPPPPTPPATPPPTTAAPAPSPPPTLVATPTPPTPSTTTVGEPEPPGVASAAYCTKTSTAVGGAAMTALAAVAMQ